MKQTGLAPTLWRTCRVLANSTRQRILEALCKRSPLTVSAVMAACGIDEPKASCHLRALQSRGLLVAERVGRRVFYHLQTDPLVAGADEMLAALRASIRRHDPISSRMHCLTAFTHPRRIQVVRGLDASPMRATELVIRCGISAPALHRHLAKLRRRGLVEAEGESVWHLTRPEQGFARDLVDLVLAK